jgi:protein TonB
MDAQTILQADILDIVFEGRNKGYGAYELRKSYRKRLISALIIMTVLCLLLMAVVLLANGKKTTKNMIIADTIDLTKIAEEKKPEPPPVQPPRKVEIPKVETAKFTTFKPVKDEEVKEPPPDMDKLAETKIGTINQEGVKDPNIVAPPVEEKGTGLAEAPKVKKEDYDSEFTTVQVEARFPGGAAEWYKFLERNLNRDLPTENGAPPGRYPVVVSFLVDKEGNISEVKAENNPGYGTAEEAVRVIKKGPRWIPALQNGRNVIYRQRQTIIFQVDSE